ncbi:MAG TPA: hypothetical protein VGK59_21110 [Ohtaekwangia sp.]
MKATLYFSVLLFLFQASACSEDESTSAKDNMIRQLTESTWIAESVEHGTDGDLTFQYDDFSIAFTSSESGNFLGDYLVANGGYAFADAFGKWTVSEDLHTLMLDNDQELTVEFQGEKMILDFTVNPSSGGRSNGLSGHFTFTLIHTP